MRLFSIIRRRRQPKRWTNEDQPNRAAAEDSTRQQYLPGGRRLRKPSLKQVVVLSAAVLDVACHAASTRADSQLLFYNADTGGGASGVVDRNGAYSDLKAIGIAS